MKSAVRDLYMYILTCWKLLFSTDLGSSAVAGTRSSFCFSGLFWRPKLENGAPRCESFVLCLGGSEDRAALPGRPILSNRSRALREWFNLSVRHYFRTGVHRSCSLSPPHAGAPDKDLARQRQRRQGKARESRASGVAQWSSSPVALLGRKG